MKRFLSVVVVLMMLLIPGLCLGAGIEGRWNVSIDCDTSALDVSGNFQMVDQSSKQTWDLSFVEEYNWFGPGGWMSGYYVNAYDTSGVFQGSGYFHFYRDSKGTGFISGYLYSACVTIDLTKKTKNAMTGSMHTQAFRSNEYCDAIIGFPSQIGIVDASSCKITMKR